MFNHSSNSTLDCPIYTKEDDEWIDFFNFWVGGVIQTLAILFGFFGKLFTVFSPQILPLLEIHGDPW